MVGIVAPGGVLFIYLFYLTNTCIREEAEGGGGVGGGGRLELPVEECEPLLIPFPKHCMSHLSFTHI